MPKKKFQPTIDSFFVRTLRSSPRKAATATETVSTVTVEETSTTIVEHSQQNGSSERVVTCAKMNVDVEVDTCSSTISCVPESPPYLNEESEESSSSDGRPMMFNVTELFKKTSAMSISTACDIWDNEHVRLPASRKCVYPTTESISPSKAEPSGSTTPDSSQSNKKFASKWEMINKAFRDPIRSTYELEDAIMSYNHLNKYMNFETLHHLFNNEMKAADTKNFFNSVLPTIISLALSIPELFDAPIPLLRKGNANSVTLSQKQVACLLANAFLCTFPRRLDDYPSINFGGMFAFPRRRVSQSSQDPLLRLKTEKLKFIVHYFRRVAVDIENRSNTFVTFARHCLAKTPKWSDFSLPLTICKIHSEGTIESNGIGMLQMDFANCFIGGGVLDEGSVQEEIRFLICPELIASRLFVERIDDNEAILITGCEQFSTYSGYGSSLTWAGDFRDNTPRDSCGRIDTRVVAADATHFSSSLQQFQPHFINRELTKALAAFYPVKVGENGRNCSGGNPSAVATGNWGCGVFGGDPHVKFLIQLLAASVAGRDLVYFTFSDPILQSDLQKMYDFLVGQKLAVNQIYRLLLSYYSNVILVSPRSRNVPVKLYPFIYQQFS